MNPPSLTFLTEEEFNRSLRLNHLVYRRDIVNDKSTAHFDDMILKNYKVHENIV